MNKTKLSLILAVAAAASSVSAAVINETSGIVPGGFISGATPSGGTTTTTAANLLVDSFDASLGSLNSVTYTLTYYSYASYNVVNDTATVNGVYTFTWQLGDILNKNSLNEPGVNPDTLFAGVLQNDQIIVPNNSIPKIGNTISKTDTFGPQAAATPAAFLGNGVTQVTFVFTPNATSGINGPQGTIENPKPGVFYAAKIDVVYDYTPTGVPEASTYAAGAVVLAGAGMILRRRMVAAKA